MVLFVPHNNCKHVNSPKALKPKSGKLLRNHNINKHHNNSCTHSSWSKHSPVSASRRTQLNLARHNNHNPNQNCSCESRTPRTQSTSIRRELSREYRACDPEVGVAGPGELNDQMVESGLVKSEGQDREIETLGLVAA